jgi:hypothetical protein
MLAAMPAIIDDFISKTEARYKQAGAGPAATKL